MINKILYCNIPKRLNNLKKNSFYCHTSGNTSIDLGTAGFICLACGMQMLKLDDSKTILSMLKNLEKRK